MFNKIKRITLGLGIALTITSCVDSNDSGPCDYTSEKFKMTIIDVLEDSTIENMYHVYVDFDGTLDWANEIQELSNVRDVTTDYDFIINNNIKPGINYTGTAFIKVENSGDCEAFFVDWDQKLRN